MTEDQRRNSGSNQERNSAGIIWVLVAVGLAVAAIAFLFSSSTRRIRYPDLLRLVEETRYESWGSRELAVEGLPIPLDGIADGTIVVPSTSNPEIRIEYSRPNNLQVTEEEILGTVFWRQLNADGTTSREPTEVQFETRRTFRNEAEEQKLIALLNENRILWDSHQASTFFADYGLTLIMIAVLIGFGFMMLRRVSGVGSPMAFSRSRGKLYAENETPVTFDDVAGIEEAVEEVREVVDFLRSPDKYQKLGGRIPKGVLLVGPPGTGKTLLARAIAGEAGVPFFSLSGSDFVEMFVGVGAARVRDMFQQAISRSPCIIFIDELDALGKSRSGSVVGGHDEREQTLNALLVEMDGFDSTSSVIVIAATNRPETLDPALLRPGRFDRHVLVDRPDAAGREDILKVHVKNVKLDGAIQLKEIASITTGFVGADLENLVNEAALLAARGDKKSVSIVEFNEAVERVTAGLEKKKRVMNEDEKIRVAYHEAGHALVAYALPNTDQVHKVSIIPRGIAALGYTMQRPEGDRYLMTKTELESQIRVLLAGTLTEELVFDDISTGAQNDLERATAIARGMVMDYGMSRMGRVNFRESNKSAFLAGGGDPSAIRMHSEETAREIDQEVTRILDEALRQTSEILLQRRDALEAITQRLLEVEQINGEVLMELIEKHSPGPRVVPGSEKSSKSTQRAKLPKTQAPPEVVPPAEGQI
ncbi:ATP-dependent zinc metalloprotease FtsH [Planctomycetaceae bacterium SH139]